MTCRLRSENNDSPRCVILPEWLHPLGSAANRSNGCLPTSQQGTPLCSKGSLVLYLRSQSGITREHQRSNLDFLAEWNEQHARQQPDYEKLVPRMASYELVFRMQTEVPGVIDIAVESEKTLATNGVGNATTDS